MFMMRSFLVTVLLVTAVAATAVAGTIEGKVSPGKSVVYVDTIQGKTFPAPSKQPVMDQKGLMFNPHVMAVQVGTTVEFQNSDTVQHNVFWPSISGNKKLGHNLGTWPKGEKKAFKFDNPGVVSLLCNVHPARLVVLLSGGPAGEDSAGIHGSRRTRRRGGRPRRERARVGVFGGGD